MLIILAHGKNHGPVTTANFDQLSELLKSEMAKSNYSSANPYATTFSANHQQTMAIDILNKKLDLYFANKIKKDDVNTAFENTESVLIGSGQALHFNAMLLQMKQDFSSKNQCKGRIIAITTMMRGGGGGPITAREEQDNINRVKEAVKNYQFHVLTDDKGTPALPDSIQGKGVAATSYSEMASDGQKTEGKFKPYWDNRRATNKWLRELMDTENIPVSDPKYNTSYKHEDYDQYARQDYKSYPVLRMYGNNKNKYEAIIEIGNTIAVVGLFTIAGCSIAYAIIPGVNLLILGVVAAVGSAIALSGIITNLVCSGEVNDVEQDTKNKSAAPTKP